MIDLVELDERLKRGERYVQSWAMLYGLNRLNGHAYVSSFVKATACRLGCNTYYQPRWWQKYI